MILRTGSSSRRTCHSVLRTERTGALVHSRNEPLRVSPRAVKYKRYDAAVNASRVLSTGNAADKNPSDLSNGRDASRKRKIAGNGPDLSRTLCNRPTQRLRVSRINAAHAVRIRPRRDVPAEIAVAAIFRTHRQTHTRTHARTHARARTHCVRTCNQTAETAFAIPFPPFQRPLTLLASPRDPERSERANRLDCRPKTFAGHYERNDQSLKSSKGEGHASHGCRVMNVQTLPVSWRPHLETLNRPRDSGNIHRGFIAPCRMARLNHVPKHGATSRPESQNIRARV